SPRSYGTAPAPARRREGSCSCSHPALEHVFMAGWNRRDLTAPPPYPSADEHAGPCRTEYRRCDLRSGVHEHGLKLKANDVRPRWDPHAHQRTVDGVNGRGFAVHSRRPALAARHREHEKTFAVRLRLQADVVRSIF